MNRQERRGLEKRIRKSNNDSTIQGIRDYIKTVDIANAIRDGGTGVPSPPKKFENGDRLYLNVELIKARKNYDRMADSYKEFVESNKGTIFTAQVERENLISLEECPRWLFWSGELDMVDVRE